MAISICRQSHYSFKKNEVFIAESTNTAQGQTTVPADIRQAIGGVPGIRLVWNVLSDGGIAVRVKNKSLMALKDMITPPRGNRIAITDIQP